MVTKHKYISLKNNHMWSTQKHSEQTKLLTSKVNELLFKFQWKRKQLSFGNFLHNIKKKIVPFNIVSSLVIR